jgi:gliding motility-associated-like protein
VQLVNAVNYAVTATITGCTSSPASTTAIVHPLPSAPVVSGNASLCEGSNLALSAGSINNAAYLWTGPNGFTAAVQNPFIPNAGLSASGSYSVKAIVNGCSGPAGTIGITVYPIPSAPTVSSNGPVCEGTTINLAASSIANATYSWMGPNGFTSFVQQPSIANATTAAAGIYSVTATVNGCTSTSATGTVTVHTIPSSPVITGNNALCEGTTLSLAASTITGAAYSWTGPNSFSSALQNPVISNVNTSHSGNYFVTATVNGCTSAASNSNVTVTSLPTAPTVSSNSPVCTGSVLSLNAASMPGAIYNWTGPNGFSSALQNPVLPAASMADNGTYLLTVTLNGCTSAGASAASVVVHQTPVPPMVTNDGPVCAGGNVHLSAFSIPGAGYNWTGPAGFASSAQNITLSAVTYAQSGNYYATVTVNGCTSTRVYTPVNIDQPALAYAGKDQFVCSAGTSVSLNGTISGGTNAGLWTTNGSGTFSPSSANLNANYFPSAADRAMGSVTLDLTSVQNGTCPAAASSLSVKFVLSPSADAGGDQVVCANKATVVLDGKTGNAAGARWTSSGSGFFSPSDTILETTYIPGASDKSRGSVILNLATTGNGPCPAATDQLLVSIKTPPLIHTGGIQYVLENNSLVLAPVVSGSNLKFSWTPAIYLNNDAVINPVCSPKADVSYTVVARDQFDCAASADVSVKLLKQPGIPNVFTPNGDGVNDRWQIRNLKDYPDCRVEIFNRYGQSVYTSTGYTHEWNGELNGKPLPAGTYYYIINQKTGLKPLSGFVDIVR